MSSVFFPPQSAFAWVFCGVLIGLTAAAAYLDFRYLVIPKQLSMTTLVLGIFFNLIRGAWLGAAQYEVWTIGAVGPLSGAFDALLFSLSGFATGFVLFFMFWIMGTCGGGDVKLFAATGAWLGPQLIIMVLVGTLLLVVLLGLGRLLIGTFFRGLRRSMQVYSAAMQHQVPQRRLLAFSLPLAFCTFFVVLWVFRTDLCLATPDSTQQLNQASTRHLN